MSVVKKYKKSYEAAVKNYQEAVTDLEPKLKSGEVEVDTATIEKEKNYWTRTWSWQGGP